MKTIKETIEGIHWHFVIIAGNEGKDEGGRKVFNEPVTLDIIEAETEEEALAVAKNKVKRGKYIVNQMRQCAQCGVQKEMAQYMRKVAKEITDD